MPNECDTCMLCNNGWCDIWNCAVDNVMGLSCQHYDPNEEDEKVETED